MPDFASQFWCFTDKLCAELAAAWGGQRYLNRFNPEAALPARMMLLESEWMLLTCFNLLLHFPNFSNGFPLVKSGNISHHGKNCKKGGAACSDPGILP